MNSVGERLAYTRSTILSMNQKDFSKLLGVSQGALSEIENNKRGLPMEAIIELMKYSKTDNSISCSWILTGDSKGSEMPAKEDCFFNDYECALLAFQAYAPATEKAITIR